MILCISLGISGILTAVFVSKNKMVKRAYNATQYIDVNNRSIARREDTFRTSRTTSYVIPKSTSSGGGGHRGSFSGSSGRSASRGGGRRR